MSGGGSPGPYGSGPSEPASDCRIVERVILNSPNPQVLATLRQGDELDVVLAGNALVAQPKAGPPPAGALTPARLADLIDCINRGHEYKAIVQKVGGGRCDVEIRPK